MSAEMDRAAWMLPNEPNGLMVPGIEEDPELLLRLANARMPFGRYRGELLLDVPQEYIFWFANRPAGRGSVANAVSGRDAKVGVGVQLAAIYALRFNGHEPMLRALVDGEKGESGSVERAPFDPNSGEDPQPDELEWILSMLGMDVE